MFRNNFLYRLRWRRCRPRCTACWRGRRLPSTYKTRPPTRDGWYQTWPTALQLWCAWKVQYDVWLNPDTVCFIYGIKSISQSAFDSNTTKTNWKQLFSIEKFNLFSCRKEAVGGDATIFIIIVLLCERNNKARHQCFGSVLFYMWIRIQQVKRMWVLRI
mgnify:CR=1 FL=1